MLAIENLSKQYGSKDVLHEISLSFKPGMVYGIVGENGAGKTTLFRCISGMESYSGAVTSSFDSIKDHLGYLETNPVLMSYLTGWEYLKLMCSSKNIDTELFEEQNIFDLPLDQYADTYSTGMKKKLTLMGLLLRKNDIIILDEPFNGVDLQSNMIILDIINQLKSLGKTILISSHIFSTLNEVCDTILLLSQGRIVKRVDKLEFGKLEKSMKAEIISQHTKKIILE